MSAANEIRVPDMGGFNDVAVIDVLVSPGQSIELDTPLATLETDKATMDVPATTAGVVEKVHIVKGGKVSMGDLVVTLRAAAAAQASVDTQPVDSKPEIAPKTPIAVAAAPQEPQKIDVLVPDMGGFNDVAVIDVLVSVGQSIELDTPLATLETDKATMDVPATAAGTVEQVE
jgi:pyruvate dehydrogenase E2 component (dihydrolipoamide acetyltransferase)